MTPIFFSLPSPLGSSPPLPPLSSPFPSSPNPLAFLFFCASLSFSSRLPLPLPSLFLSYSSLSLPSSSLFASPLFPLAFLFLVSFSPHLPFLVSSSFSLYVPSYRSSRASPSSNYFRNAFPSSLFPFLLLDSPSPHSAYLCLFSSSLPFPSRPQSFHLSFFLFPLPVVSPSARVTVPSSTFLPSPYSLASSFPHETPPLSPPLPFPSFGHRHCTPSPLLPLTSYTLTLSPVTPFSHLTSSHLTSTPLPLI